jgi:hypothetical protein
VGDLPQAATWADVIKKQDKSYSWSKALHYTNTAPWAKTYTADNCHKGRCVVTAIANYTKRVSEGSQAQRGESLKFLAHFVGDIHQPLHVGFKRDYGGNKIKGSFLGKPTNLHSVWDFDVLAKRLQTDFKQDGMKGFAAHLAARIKKQPARASAWVRCKQPAEATSMQTSSCPVEWAKESAVLASQIGYKDRTGKVIKQGFQFGEADYVALVPLIDHQLMKGGARLAAVLDSALKCNGVEKASRYIVQPAAGMDVPADEDADAAVPADETTTVDDYVVTEDSIVPEAISTEDV